MKRYLLLIVAIAVSTALFSAYFENIPKTLEQPDGTKFKCFISGDEFFNRYHDENGYTIIRGKEGFFCYAVKNGENIVASDYIVGSVNPQSVGISPDVIISPEEYQARRDRFYAPTIIERNERPADDHINNIVVFIRFSDQTEFDTPLSTFDTNFNDTTTVSLRDYYREVTYGQLEVTSTYYPVPTGSTVLSYQDTHSRDYFMPYDSNTNTNGYQNDQEKTSREHNLLRDAVNTVSSQIPTSLNLDYNNDNLVDNVCFIVRGDQEGWADLLWAHRWSLYSHDVFINGKRVFDYTFQPEPQSSVNTLCHEMFHVLSAPDLYHYNYDGFTPVGPWDLMSSGFGHMMAYMKYRYGGWIDNIPVINSGTHTLYPLTSETNNCFRINNEFDSNEYFIVEYRSELPGTYEQNCPQSGMLVYRIDTDHDGDGNAYGGDEVYVFRYNGTTNDDGNIYDAVLSTDNGRTEIHNTTNPNMYLSYGLPSGIHIYNVQDYGDSLTFILNPSTSNISGTVSVDSNLGNLSDVELHIGSYTVPVQPNGSYSCDVYTGNYNIIASLNGFATFSTSVDVAPSQQVTQDITMNILPYPDQFNHYIDNGTLRIEWTMSDVMPDDFTNYFAVIYMNDMGETLRSNIYDQFLEFNVSTSFFDSISVEIKAQYTTGDSYFSDRYSWYLLTDNNQSNVPVYKTGLISNYPNPFNPETTIKYSLAEKSNATIDIYNIIGQKVKSFDKGTLKAGEHEVKWMGDNSNGKSVSSGMYFYKLNVDGKTKDIKKMMLLK